MTTERDELAELLARATVAESKAAAVAEALEDPDLTPDAREDLEAQRQAALLGVPELEARIEELQDQVLALSLPDDDDDWDDDEVEPGDVGFADLLAASEQEDEPKGYDFDDDDEDEPAPLEGKAAGKAGEPCPECGSTGVDELVDGTSQCEDCGWPLERGETKGVDFTDDDEDEPEPEPELEAKGDTVALSEMELLQARRAAL